MFLCPVLLLNTSTRTHCGPHKAAGRKEFRLMVNKVFPFLFPSSPECKPAQQKLSVRTIYTAQQTFLRDPNRISTGTQLTNTWIPNQQQRY